MQEQFDTFQPLQTLKHLNFSFNSTRFELWENGKMIKSGAGDYFLNVHAAHSAILKTDYLEMEINNESIEDIISHRIMFDKFISQTDRLQMVSVPSSTQTDCPGLVALRNVIGATRNHFDFRENYPFCGNIFLKNGIIVKMSFSFAKPLRLFELYI